jgi:predicted ATPase
MIRAIEAFHFRILRRIRQDIDDFQILVGSNASGKSTFLDAVGLLGDLLSEGLVAVRDRSQNVLDLVWMGDRDRQARFEIGIELMIPFERTKRLCESFKRARYELAIGLDAKGELCILDETLWLKPLSQRPRWGQGTLLGPPDPLGFVTDLGGQGWKKVVHKEEGTGFFFSETTDWSNPFRFGPQRLALANLPEDEDLFPVATWVKRTLMEGVQRVVLNSEIMRLPSPPGSRYEFQPDGSTLPWAVEELKKDGKIFRRWIEHIRTALPDVETIETIEREEDRHRYLRIVYKNGLKAPSWTVSDGTLRLLALTLIGYLKGSGRVYLIEEPENGIHPQAVETVFQSLSSSYGNQILCATHSPVFLAMAEPEQVLCFSRTSEGATEIVRGSEHPNLRDWKRSTDLGTLFATGILG